MCLSFIEAEELDDMVGVLLDPIATWKIYGTISLRSSIDTQLTYITTCMQWNGQGLWHLRGGSSTIEHIRPIPCGIGDPNLDESDVFFSAEENEDIDILDDNLVSEYDNFDIGNRRWWTGHGIPTWWQWGPPVNKGGSTVKVWPHPQDSGRSFGESMESWFRLGISQKSVYIEINQIIDFLEYHESAEVTCEDLEELNDTSYAWSKTRTQMT